MDEYGENPIESMLRPVADYAAEKQGQLGKVGFGLLAVGLFVSSAPLALAGAGAFFGSQIYKRYHAPTINNFLDEASQEYDN
jgi:hypothetical protein